MKYELLIYNAKIFSLDKKNSVYDWMTINNGRLIHLGENQPSKSEFDNAQEIIDLKGYPVYPGFFDSHVHLVQTGLNLMSLDLSQCTSIEEVKQCIKTYINKKECDEKTIIYGYGLDETKILERKLPDRRDLDECSKEYPIWLNRIEFHKSVVNSRALHLSSIPFTLRGIEREASGLPTGRFTSEASAWIRNFMFNRITDERREEGIRLAVDSFLEKGVTSINCMEGGYMFHDKDADYIYQYHNQFSIDMYLYYQTTDIKKIMNMGLKRVGGDIFIDGSFGSHTAALSEPYYDKPSTCGTLFFDQETINDFVEQAHRNGIQVSVHAIGDRAIDQILNAYEKVMKKYPDIYLRHRIEHFELPTDDQIERASKLDVILSVQPAYEYYWGELGGMYAYRLGNKRRNNTNPFRKYIESNITITGGSDCHVTPCNPLLGIHSAVNHPIEKYALTVDEAVRMFTINGAIAVNDIKNKGSLEANKLADFVVLSTALNKVESNEIKNIDVLATYKEGIELYHKEGDLFV